MILVDYSQIAISNSSVIRTNNKGELPIELLRHQILNSLRKYNVKFSNEYGELIVCCDGNKYWRKDIFPQYKADREKAKNEKTIEMFEKMDIIRDEIKELFPFKLIRFDNLEADDVIAILSKNTTERTLIISADKDFQQLQSLRHIKQYTPLGKDFIECRKPNLFLKELIIRGDKGDGIPNILSDDNYIVDKIRQPSIRQTDLDVWLYSRPEDFCKTEVILKNYQRNKMLIAFTEIPDNLAVRVLQAKSMMVLNQKSEKVYRAKLFLYFKNHQMNELGSKIDDFFL